MDDDEIKNFDDLPSVDPTDTDKVLCGRGRIAFSALMSLMKGDIETATELVNSYKTAAEETKTDIEAIYELTEELLDDTTAVKEAAEQVLTDTQAVKADTQAVKAATEEVKTATEEIKAETQSIITEANAEIESQLELAESYKNIAAASADSATQVVGLQALSQLSQRQGKFYLNGGAMYATVDLIGSYFNSFSICATIDSAYTGTIFSYGYISSETDDDGNVTDTSSYFMAKVSDSSIVVSSSVNGDLISYDISGLTSDKAIVISSDGSTLALSINGTSVASATLDGDVPAGENTLIFGSYANSTYFPYAYGIMWNVKAFNFDMSDTDTPYSLSDYATNLSPNQRASQTIQAIPNPCLLAWNYETTNGYVGTSMSAEWTFHNANGGRKFIQQIKRNSDGSITDTQDRTYYPLLFTTSLLTTDLDLSYFPEGTEYIGEVDDTYSQINVAYTLPDGEDYGLFLKSDYEGATVSYGLRLYSGGTTTSSTLLDTYFDKNVTLKYEAKLMRIGKFSSSANTRSSFSGANKDTSLSTSAQWFSISNTFSISKRTGTSYFSNSFPAVDATNYVGRCYILTGFKAEIYGKHLDLFDFSVKENDTSRQILDGSKNQNNLSITGYLSGDKDEVMDTYQSYQSSQIIQEINLSTE